MKVEFEKRKGFKTQVANIFTTKDEDYLGTVKWKRGWRQYAYFPAPCTLYNDGCLRAIADFLKEMNDSHKANRM